MFICRACRGQQQRLFSSVPAQAAVKAQAGVKTDALSAFVKAARPRSIPPSLTSRGQGRVPGRVSSRAARSGPKTAAEKEEEARKSKATQEKFEIERQLHRPWRIGDVYAPHDLSPTEMSKWKLVKPRGKQKKDLCDTLGINPLDYYKNVSIMSEYITDTGRIKGHRDTGLRPVNQRKMAKAIRRSVACGLMPSVYKHPELLRIQYQDSLQENSSFQRKRRGAY